MDSAFAFISPTFNTADYQAVEKGTREPLLYS